MDVSDLHLYPIQGQTATSSGMALSSDSGLSVSLEAKKVTKSLTMPVSNINGHHGFSSVSQVRQAGEGCYKPRAPLLL